MVYRKFQNSFIGIQVQNAEAQLQKLVVVSEAITGSKEKLMQKSLLFRENGKSIGSDLYG